MIVPDQHVKILVATRPVDFRKGHDGLTAVVQNELWLDPFSGIIVVFRAKRVDRIKALLWGGSGLEMIYKRLETDKFSWPGVHDRVIRLSKTQFEALFEGLDLSTCLWRAAGARADCGRVTQAALKNKSCSSESRRITAMKTSRNTLSLDALPADIRAAFLAKIAARIAAEKRAERLEKFTSQLEKSTSQLEERARRLEYLLAEFKHAVWQVVRKDQRRPVGASLRRSGNRSCRNRSGAGRDAGKEPKQPARRNLGRLPIGLPRIEKIIEPESLMYPCGCGEQMVKIGEDRSERLDILPARFRATVTIRPKYAVRCNCGGKVVQAPAHLIEGGLPSEGLVAHVLVSKYADHLPLYRQSQIFAHNSGLDLHRSPLAGWCVPFT